MNEHRHAPDDLLRAFDRENGFVGVVFKCGCTATYTTDGKALTGGESIRDIPQDVLRAKIDTPASCSPDVVELVERLRHMADNHHAIRDSAAMTQAADALESMMREKDAMVEHLEQIVSAWAFAHNIDGAARNDLFARFRAALDMTLDKGR
jgi:hypothetical protein